MARVLLIEDNEAQRDLYHDLLYYNGFDVLTAEDAQTGISLATAELPDVIVLDVMLPGVSGLVAAQRLTRHPTTAHIPIICTSAYDVSPHMIEHSGAKEFLPKPIDPSDLVKAIWRQVGRDHSNTVAHNGEEESRRS